MNWFKRKTKRPDLVPTSLLMQARAAALLAYVEVLRDSTGPRDTMTAATHITVDREMYDAMKAVADVVVVFSQGHASCIACDPDWVKASPTLGDWMHEPDCLVNVYRPHYDRERRANHQEASQ